MTRTTQQKIHGLIAAHTEVTFDDDTPISGLIDSLDLCEVIMDMEHMIGADINDDDVEACQTVGDVVKLGRG